MVEPGATVHLKCFLEPVQKKLFWAPGNYLINSRAEAFPIILHEMSRPRLDQPTDSHGLGYVFLEPIIVFGTGSKKNSSRAREGLAGLAAGMIA